MLISISNKLTEIDTLIAVASCPSITPVLVDLHPLVFSHFDLSYKDAPNYLCCMPFEIRRLEDIDGHNRLGQKSPSRFLVVQLVFGCCALSQTFIYIWLSLLFSK